jgi:hypothetical protein
MVDGDPLKNQQRGKVQDSNMSSQLLDDWSTKLNENPKV